MLARVIMTDIELLEHYAKQRQKYRSRDFFAKCTDIQRLNRIETSCWTMFLYFGLNMHYLVDGLLEDRIVPKLAGIGYLAFMGYLMFEIYRTSRLRSLFENTAVQNATDLIEILKRAPSPVLEAISEPMQEAVLSAEQR